MPVLKNNIGLYTDHYELTMAQGYLLTGKQDVRAGFDYFFRKNPYEGGFVIFAGLQNLLDVIKNYKFDSDDCKYIESMGFQKPFVNYLKSFSFKGNIYSVREGEVVFPNEPILRVEGNLIETQLIESLLLNMINFQSLIATKAARMSLVAEDKQLVDFGLRRAQGLGAVHASRAAMIGGFNSSSNVFSARLYNFQSTGTMAHSWVQTFNNELDAFQEFVRLYPDQSILLVDTYDTLNQGLPNAIKVAKHLEKNGHKLVGIRLDSGDLANLSKSARKQLDNQGLDYVKIIVSNQLDEYLIRSLKDQKAPIDGYGVGTSLVIGKGSGALDGVYKLTHVDNKPTMKVSENIAKMTLPGKKNVYRYTEPDGTFAFDGIEILNAKIPKRIFYPKQMSHCKVEDKDCEELLVKVMENGNHIGERIEIKEIAQFCKSRLKKLKPESKRFENPHIFIVGLGDELRNLQEKLKKEML